MPQDMVIVSQAQFYAALAADPRDIMPFLEPENRYVSLWCTNDTRRQPWGWNHCSESYPIVKQYAVLPAALERLTGAQP